VQLARDYTVVAACPKFRASERSRIRGSIRAAMVVVIVAASLNCLWLIPFHPSRAGLLILLNLVAAMVAGCAYAASATRARRHPEALALVVLASIDITLVALGEAGNELDVVAWGYILLMPMIVAAVIPWSTRFHAGWLGLHVLAVLAYAELVPNGLLGGAGRRDALALFLVAIAVSLVGNLNRLQGRVVSFIQIQQIRAFNRQARRDHERLDRLNQILEHSARTDALTGLGNRLSLNINLTILRARIARRGETLGLLMIDLDHFKAINDGLGHVAGDQILRDTAACISAAVRQEDSVYRYGGEEFLVLIEATDADGAETAAERIRQAVRDLRLLHTGNPPHGRITVSVGIATVGPDDLADDDDAWIGRSDAALYRAKALGRDRCQMESSVRPRIHALPDADGSFAPEPALPRHVPRRHRASGGRQG
jgi:diguanylate cyclase (GGDEF)-like protein